MSSTKNLLAAALIAACAISQPVLADVTESATLPVLNTLALESTDLNFAFEQTSQPLQMATLSEQEMKETEGAWIPVWAGVVGGGFNAYNTYSNGGSWGRVAYSFGTGFSGGFFASLPGGGAVLQVGRMIVGGAMAASPYPFSFR